jgi:hypothetical protein
MIGQAVLYAASRATSDAIDGVARRVIWTAVAAVFLVSALIFALVLAFWSLEPRLGAIQAAGAIAAVCLLVGLVALSMPWLIQRTARLFKKQQTAAAATVAAVDEEAKEAVDYFGALQVVGAAFLFGLGAARRLKR